MSGELSFSFIVTNGSGVAVSGEDNDDFTCHVYRDGGSCADTVTVTELGNGAYKAGGDASNEDKYHIDVSNDNSNLVNGLPVAAFDIDAGAIANINKAANMPVIGAILTPAWSGMINYENIKDLETWFSLTPYDYATGAGIYADDITNVGTVTIDRIRNGVETTLVDDAVPDKDDGSLEYAYTFTDADWQPGDEVRIYFDNPEVLRNGGPIPFTKEMVFTFSKETNILERGINNATYAVAQDVVDQDTLPLPGVLLRITDADGKTLTQATTNAGDGEVVLNLEAGSYRIYPTLPGYGFSQTYFDRVVTEDEQFADISATELPIQAASDPGRCRVYHYADDADQPSGSLSGVAQPYPLPQFSGDSAANRYTGHTNQSADLQKQSDGLFYFDNLKQGSQYLFTIKAENIGSKNGVLQVPDSFTGGTEGIAYLIQTAEGNLQITATPPA